MKILPLSIIIIAVLFLSGCSLKKEDPISILEMERQNKEVSEEIRQEQEGAKKVMKEEINVEYAEKYSGAVLKTNLGDIEVEFFGEASPKTVSNFLQLADSGFYNGTKFHRVIKDFMIQGGDPFSKNGLGPVGTGDPGYKFEDEINSFRLVRGSLAMANSGPNTNGSQFFIVTAESTEWLDGKHTNFGKVVSGMEVVDKIEQAETGAQDKPIEDVVITAVSLIEP